MPIAHCGTNCWILALPTAVGSVAALFFGESRLPRLTTCTVVNILTDLAMVALPVLVVVDLQVNRKTKISLVLILSLGLL